MDPDPPSQAVPARGSRRAERASRYIITGATALTLGIMASLTESGTLAPALTLLGFVTAVFGLHLLGRSGPPVAD